MSNKKYDWLTELYSGDPDFGIEDMVLSTVLLQDFALKLHVEN